MHKLSVLSLLMLFSNLCGSEIAVVVEVRDDVGLPVPNAEVRVGSFDSAWAARSVAVTDNEGIARQNCSARLRIERNIETVDLKVTINKAGYYTTFQESLRTQFGERDGKNTVILKLVCKPIRNPQPMYVRRFYGKMPVRDQPVEFDMFAGDWVAPYGKGKEGDIRIVFRSEEKQYRHGPEFKSSTESFLAIEFPNRRDGIQMFVQGRQGSVFRSLYLAPENGYENFLNRYSKLSDEGYRSFNHTEDANYYFRIRSSYKDGVLVSGYYGKIYGEIQHDEYGGILLCYYLNPVSLSRNIEFDPKRNLYRATPPEIDYPVEP